MYLRTMPPDSVSSSTFAPRMQPLQNTMGFPFFSGDDSSGGGDGDTPKKETDWSSLIGIITAIVGNVLIALALNVQRLAHIRLHKKRALIRARAKQALKQGRLQKPGRETSRDEGEGGRGGLYGATAASTGVNGVVSRRISAHSVSSADAHETEPLAPSMVADVGEESSDCSDDEDIKVASTYLKDPYWWMGQILITIGEMGNFLAYGFAPASIVSPLGVVALVSNCVIAPLFFKEKFRPRDFWGVLIAIGGAVTVVLSAKQKETKLEPHDVWDAITTVEFEVYMGISCSLIILLIWLSPRYGNRTILIDLGLVGLFGGYTALSTKGVSSMLSSTLLGAFTTPVTYALLFVLLSTAVLQVRYVNKALQRFDSTQVIPIQFILFTLSVIIGSAVLFRDFERTSVEQSFKFIGGCLLTFFGVFLITSGRSKANEDEETLSDNEDIEETIRLSEQEHSSTPQQVPRPPSARRDSVPARSRRSSHISFRDVAVNKPMSLLVDTGIPSPRTPNQSNPRLATGEGLEDSPLLSNPWREGSPVPIPLLQHPGMGSQMPSSDSVLSVVPTISEDTIEPGTPPDAPPEIMNWGLQPEAGTLAHHAAERPVTPRASSSRGHSHHYSEVMISPSPFSSTVSAVVSDKLLANMDSPTVRRMVARRSRPSLRNSLFVPSEELDLDEEDRYHDESDIEPYHAIRQIRSAVDADHPDNLLPLPGNGNEQDASRTRSGGRGLRGRARSLSHTIGELFGVKRKRRNTFTDRDEEVFASGPSANT